MTNYHHCINLQNRYLKIDVHVLNLVSYDFWRQIVTLLPHSNHSKNNFKATPTLWMQGNFYGWVHTTNYSYFILWFGVWIAIWMDTTHIFFCGYRVLHLFCREPMISSKAKNGWNWNFADFRDLVLILPVAATGFVRQKKVFIKISQYSQENTRTRVSI